MNMVILIAGHGGTDKGAKGVVWKGHQLWEAELTIVVRDLIYGFMQMYLSDYPNLKIKIVKDDDSLTLNGVISWIQNVLPKSEERVIYDIHFNAFNKSANGTEVIIPKQHSLKESTLASSLLLDSVSSMGIKSRGVKDETRTARKSLAIMRPVGVNVLDEICFIDNADDMRAFFDNLTELCARKAKTLIEHFL